MNQTYSGRSQFYTDVENLVGSLLVAVKCRVGASDNDHVALLDTASTWCVLPPRVALSLGYNPEPGGPTRLHTRFGVTDGALIRLPVTFLSDEGEPTAIEATWFVSADWPGPLVIGWKGCLERMRFACDPGSDDFYFAEL